LHPIRLDVREVLTIHTGHRGRASSAWSRTSTR
jgi:hypothetical protein